MSEVMDSSSDSIQIGAGDTKAAIRVKVWDHLEQHGIALNPEAAKWTIPNFKGSEQAGAKLSELDVFKDATVVRIDLDESLQEIRFRTLEAGKTLLVPTPNRRDQEVYRKFLKLESPPLWPKRGLDLPPNYGRNHIVCRSIPPEDSSPEQLRNYATRQGIEQHSEAIDINEKVSVDAYIVGSIAVSPKGNRIGRGGLSSGWEYSILFHLGAVDRKAPIITMVHDHQVMELPNSLFGEKDLPVDIIVTPSKVIFCTGTDHKFNPSCGMDLIISKTKHHIENLAILESFHSATVLDALDKHEKYVSSKKGECKEDKQAGQSAMTCGHIKARGMDKVHFIRQILCCL